MPSENGTPPLRSIYLYITSGCNLRCRHCWVSAGPEKRAGRPELDFDTWKRIMDEAIELGLRSVKFTGGEPLLIRDTTYKLMCYLRDRNIRVNMETNGTLLDDEIAAFFGTTKGSHIAVSLDGCDQKTHDSFRGVQGSFDRTIEGMQLLAKHGVRFQVICAIRRANMHCAAEVVQLAVTLKAGSVRFLPISGMGRGNDMAQRGETLGEEETIRFCHFVHEDLASETTMRLTGEIPPAFSSWSHIKTSPRSFATCGLPHMSGLLADGTVALCGIGEHRKSTTYGNAVSLSIGTIWKSAPGLVDQRRVLKGRIKGICAICVFRGRCRGHCRAAAIDTYGRIEAPYPFCQSAYEKDLFPPNRIIGDPAIADQWVEEQTATG